MPPVGECVRWLRRRCCTLVPHGLEPGQLFCFALRWAIQARPCLFTRELESPPCPASFAHRKPHAAHGSCIDALTIPLPNRLLLKDRVEAIAAAQRDGGTVGLLTSTGWFKQTSQ